MLFFLAGELWNRFTDRTTKLQIRYNDDGYRNVKYLISLI